MSSDVTHLVQDNDEIDLFDLCSRLWKKKWMILSIAVLFVIISVIAGLVIPKTYTSEATVAQAENSQLMPANFYSSVYSLSSEEALHVYNKVLSSTKFLQAAYQQTEEYASLVKADNAGQKEVNQQTFERFKKKLTIKSNKGEITITYKGKNASHAQSFINDIILPLAQQQTNAIIVANITGALDLKREYLFQQIQQIQQNFIVGNQQRIVSLSQALQTAKKAGIDVPYDDHKGSSNVIINLSQALQTAKKSGIDVSYDGQKSKGNNVIINNDDRLFLMGSQVLSAQIEIADNTLKSYRMITKKSDLSKIKAMDKPLVPGVQSAYNQLVYLNSPHPSLSAMQPVNIVNSASWSNKASPSTKVIVIAFAVLGIIFGCLIALINIALEQRRLLTSVIEDK